MCDAIDIIPGLSTELIEALIEKARGDAATAHRIIMAASAELRRRSDRQLSEPSPVSTA